MKVQEVPMGQQFVTAEYADKDGRSIPLYKSYDGRCFEIWFGDDRAHHYLTPVSPPELANAVLINLDRFGFDANPELRKKESGK